MSIGLAISKIAEYTGQIAATTVVIGIEEQNLLLATQSKNDQQITDVQQKLTQYKTLLSLLNQFLEFWKDVIKQTLAILKMFNELATGSR